MSAIAAAPDDLGLTWRSWESVGVRVENLPHDATTFDLWRAFNNEGNIISIDIFEKPDGFQSSSGRIRFMPPPERDFWSEGSWVLRLSNPNLQRKFHKIRLVFESRPQGQTIESPVHKGVHFPKRLHFKLSKLEIGVRRNENSYFPMRVFQDSYVLKAIIDVQDRWLHIFFDCKIQQSALRQSHTADALDGLEPSVFRLKIPFVELSQIWGSFENESTEYSLMTILSSPPILHRQIADFNTSFTAPKTWRESDTWFRQVTVSHHPLRQASISTSLHRPGQIIDIGRWNVFKITLAPEQSDQSTASLIRAVLKDHNITVKDGNHFTQLRKRPSTVWSRIDYRHDGNSKASSLMQNAYSDNYVQLLFPVRYQLEVCISHGFFSEFAIPAEFLLELGKLGEKKALRLLEHVASGKKTYLDPMQIFNIQYAKGVSDAKIPVYCCFMRTAKVTPTTIYLNTPSVDLSNRVTRRFAEHSDRFLRVRFTDEKSLGGIYSCFNDTNDEIFTRVKRTLTNGITIGDRHYEFLAFGNSQLREHGAYFFAPLPHLTAAHIRAWMGSFNPIRNVAKHAARLGQCFSTTRAVAGTPVSIRMIDDIVRGKRNFSDGVGKISKFLATMTMNELKIETPNGKPPSAFQFRLGGCKGLLVVSEDPEPRQIHMRHSQHKFEAQAAGLEIIRWSQYNPASLNRQIILVLSALQVPGPVIEHKQKDMIDSVQRVMENDIHAISLLKKYVDPNEITLQLAKMVSDGFRRANEPFVSSMLQLWKAWHLKYLKEKARIIIEKSATLFGCVDETGVLKGHDDRKIRTIFAQDDRKQKLSLLPEIFVQVCRPENGGKPEIIEGLCIIARNPSLHQGDVRVVRAVNKPELRHLYDVVVFPQTGTTDLASMCSGGDLDGDDYLVIWDQELIPNCAKWFVPPMNHTGMKAPELDRDVTVGDITSFFAMYLKTDNLPRIATAHMALADHYADGIVNPKCIKLARLHSNAVDYCKTGAASSFTRDLEPLKWPHFMQRRNTRPGQVYRSRKILGRLYDAVELETFKPNLKLPFDRRILESALVADSEPHLEFAKSLKVEYDCALRRIMAQYGIKTEFEVWSSFVLNHNFQMRDYKMHEGLGNLASRLREGFRQICYEKVGRSDEKIAPLAVAMYRVTYEDAKQVPAENDKAKKESQDDAQEDESEDGGEYSDSEVESPDYDPLISFPWMFHDILGGIANGRFKLQPPGEESTEVAGPGEPKPRVLGRAEVNKLLNESDGDEKIEAHRHTQFDLASKKNVPLFKKMTTQAEDKGFGVDAQSRVPRREEIDELLMKFKENGKTENQSQTQFGLGGKENVPPSQKITTQAEDKGFGIDSQPFRANGNSIHKGPLDIVEEDEDDGKFGAIDDLLAMLDELDD